MSSDYSDSLIAGSSIGRWLLRLSAIGLLLLLAWFIGRGLSLLQQPLSRHAVGLSLLRDGNGHQAAYVFHDPVWQGVAHYRAGHWQRAASAFARHDNVLGRYNFAGSLAKLGDYDRAIQIYRGVLQERPDHADATVNLKLVMAAALAAEEQSQAQSQQRDLATFRNGIETGEQTEAPRNAENEQPEQTVSDQNSSSDNSEQQGAPRAPDREMPPQQSDAVNDGGDSSQSPAFAPQDTSASGRVNNPLEEPLLGVDGRAIGASKRRRNEERQMAEEILLREIHDDPVTVLRARLKSILEQRRALR